MKTISFTAFLLLLATSFLSGSIFSAQNSENKLINAEKTKNEIDFFTVSDTTIVAENRISESPDRAATIQSSRVESDHYTLRSFDPVNLNVLENDRIPDNFILEILTAPENGSAKLVDKAILYTPSPEKRKYTDTITYRAGIENDPDSYSTGKAVIDVLQEEEKPALEDFRVYPNPTSGFINVFLPGKVLVEYEIMIIDPSGKEVLHQQNVYSSFPFRFNTENLEKGIYLVRLISDDDSITKKIIVN